LYNTRGVRTTGGSKILADFVPTDDATVVSRLRAAGAIVLGRLNMHEFAYGPEGLNAHYGDAMNPWDARAHRIAGGSSSGSGVAVAAALVPAALGSDTGGSIRIPAALCGISGVKPTYGRVSRAGGRAGGRGEPRRDPAGVRGLLRDRPDRGARLPRRVAAHTRGRLSAGRARAPDDRGVRDRRAVRPRPAGASASPPGGGRRARA